MSWTAPDSAAATSKPPRPFAVRLGLLGGFELLVDGVRVDVPFSAERVVAYLGLHGRPQPRAVVARSLWPVQAEGRAVANLRGALWKLREVKDLVVEPHADRLSLAAGVVVDVLELVQRARFVLECARDIPATEFSAPADLVDGLSLDVLPEWDEDWVVFERERVRQLRIHAIEALSSQLLQQGRHGDAVEAGLAAVAADPLRESAQRVLIEAHLAEGNAADARRQFEAYRQLLWGDLGVRPSPALTGLVTSDSSGGDG